MAVFFSCNSSAGIVYVSATDGSDENDGSSWVLAKQTIQAGVDAAASNDTVKVTNGTYNTGSRIPPGQILCQTRLVIEKEVSVVSVNGPSNTFIVGQGPQDENAIRCVWMTNNTHIIGFTLTNGHSIAGIEGSDRLGGSVFATTSSAIISNCIITACQSYEGGGAYHGTLNNCILTGNSADHDGGGAYGSTLNNCTLTSNSADQEGGGAYDSILNDCTLTGNSAISGGGANECTIINCTLTGNSANYGGGAENSSLNNCELTGNSASSGAGTEDSTLNNCTLTSNSADQYGGGARGGTLNNCTLTGNSAGYNGGGGAQSSTLNNCTVYANTNIGISGGTARNTICFGNTESEMDSVSSLFCYTNVPSFLDTAAGNLRLQSNSPCINSGNNLFAPTNVTPYDLDRNPRIAQLTVDIGAYEFQGVEFFDLLVSAGPHGIISPSGVIRTNQGADITFVIQPYAYYHVENILTNGESAGTATNFTWANFTASGTVTVSFAATLATKGTPHWWLAQWGWITDFDTVESLDQDEDGLFTWEEYPYNTCPTNANSDGDQYDDGVEINTGADPLHNDSQTYGAILSQPASFNLYNSDSVQDLSYGEVMMTVVSNSIQVRLTMQSSDTLLGDVWTNVGTAVDWQCPAASNKTFFRFLGAPAN